MQTAERQWYGCGQREVQSVWTRQIPFRVDIAGVIEIMGSSLYSRVDTPIRELIQNAHDAIMRRAVGIFRFMDESTFSSTLPMGR